MIKKTQDIYEDIAKDVEKGFDIQKGRKQKEKLKRFLA